MCIYIDKNYTIANAVLCNKEKILSWFCGISYCEIQLFTVESIIELVASVIQEMCEVVDSNPFSSVKERGLLDSLWRYHGNPLGDALILDWQLCPFSAMETWISSLESLALFTPGSSRLEGKPTAVVFVFIRPSRGRVFRFLLLIAYLFKTLRNNFL